MPGKPCLRRIQCSIRYQHDRLTQLQIADDRRTNLAPPEGKIINTYDGEFIPLIGNTAANHSQKRVIAPLAPSDDRQRRRWVPRP